MLHGRYGKKKIHIYDQEESFIRVVLTNAINILNNKTQAGKRINNFFERSLKDRLDFRRRLEKPDNLGNESIYLAPLVKFSY